MRKSSGADYYCTTVETIELVDRIYADPKSLKNLPPPGVRSLDEMVKERSSSSMPYHVPQKHDRLGQAILAILLDFGGSANLQEIGEEVNKTPEEVFRWIHDNQLRVSGLKRLSPGRYGFNPRKNARLPSDLVSDFTKAYFKGLKDVA